MMPLMTRRELLAGLATSSAAARWSASRRGRSSGHKNLLIIMADQHKRDCLGIAGDPVARTPNLDAFARSAVRFTRAYCANPVCTPSRASLLTGLYTHHHQTWNNATPWPASHQTIAHYFSRAGYFTGLIGKMHFVDAQTHGFDYKLDFNDWFQFLGPKTKLYADELSRPNSGAGMPEQDHFESFVARESVRFLRRYGHRDQPFLLICSFLKPHDPFMPAARFANMFRAEDMRLPDTWGQVNLSEVPSEVRRSILHNDPTPELRDPEQARRRIAFYYGNLAQMDDCAGIVLRELKLLGLEDETIVIYTSDHGEMLGEHGLWQKFQFYESSVGVPLMIRVPGISPGICQDPVSQVSILPTVAEFCGVPLPSPLDGDSFADQVLRPDTHRNRLIFAEYNLRTPHAKYMIRSGDYKYTFWTHDMPELYNLRNDPQEMINLALRPAYKETVGEMKEKLFAWYKPPETN